MASHDQAESDERWFRGTDEDDEQGIAANYLADDCTVRCGLCDTRVDDNGLCPHCDNGADDDNNFWPGELIS